MASFKIHGKGYQLIAYLGYDESGKQITKCKQWNPPEGMKKREINRSLPQLAAEYEQQMIAEKASKENLSMGSLTVHDLITIWDRDYVSTELRSITATSYRLHLQIIDEMLGTKKISEVTPLDITSFKNYLTCRNSYASTNFYLCQIDLRQCIEQKGYCIHNLSQKIGIAASTIRNACNGDAVRKDKAEAICQALSLKLDEAFTPKRDAKPISAGTARKGFAVLHDLFEAAVNWEMIDRNPCSRVKPPKYNHKEISVYTQEQLIALLRSIRENASMQNYLITLLLAETGMRRSEALGLQWSCIDFGTQSIHIKQSLQIVDRGKGRKRSLALGEPKTQQSNRIINIGCELISLLRLHRQEQADHARQMGDCWRANEFPDMVFTRSNGLPVFPDTYSTWLSNYSKEHGFPHITPHMLRHTKASIEVSLGKPLTEVSHNLGHASKSTTLNYYTHLLPQDRRKEADHFENLLL